MAASKLFSRAWELQHRIRRLRTIMPSIDALRLALAEDLDGDASLYLKPASRNIVVRLGTTDLSCLEKVFIPLEYRIHFLASPRVIVDAGANIGMATLYFATQYPEARIFAIEPESSNFGVLEKNCGRMPNVTLMNAALWLDRQQLVIANPSAQKYGFRMTDHLPHGSTTVRVPVVTVDDILNQIAEKHIDLLKLDIERSEFELFSRHTKDWIDRIQIIAVELHDRFRPGCAHALYPAFCPRKVVQELSEENIFIRFVSSDAF